MLWGELTYIITRTKYLLFIYKCVRKTSRLIHLYKSVCPIYARDTVGYVGSAFLSRDINYVCHFPKVEGKARATIIICPFFLCWCAETQGILHENGCAGIQRWFLLLVGSQRHKPGSAGHLCILCLVWSPQRCRRLGWLHICWEDWKAWRDSPSGTLGTLDTISQSWNVPGFLTLVVSQCRGWKNKQEILYWGGGCFSF